MSFFQNLKILLKKHYIIHFHNHCVPFHQSPTIFIQVFTSFYKFLQVFTSFYKFLQVFTSFFSFYDSKTTKSHASQSHGSGAMCELTAGLFDVLLEFRVVTEYAAKSGKLHFGCVTIKMVAFGLGYKIYIVSKHIFYEI
jgi:hypothetical protein